MVEVKYRKYKPHGAYISLSNDRFVLDVDDESGVIKGLYFKDDFNNANFMGNEENQRINVAWRGRYIPDMFHRAPIQGWTGDIVLRVKKAGDGRDTGESGAAKWTPMYTVLSDDIRTLATDDNSVTVVFNGDSQYDGGLRGVKLERRFELKRDQIEWTISIANTGVEALTIGEVGIPIVFNDSTTLGDARTGFNHGSVDNEVIAAETRVVSQSFISGHSSCISAIRVAGAGDILTILPQNGTFLEAQLGGALAPAGSPADSGMMPVAGTVFYPYSKATAKQEWYNGHREFVLEPGENRTFSFIMCRSRDYHHLAERIYEYGGLDMKVLPGMVIPEDGEAKLMIRSKKPIHSMKTDPGISIEETGKLGHRRAYSIKVSEEGPQKITVSYGNDEWANLLFYGVRPLEELIHARGRFIREHQQVFDPDDKCCYSFRSYNNDEGRMVGRDDPYACGIMEFGGSDDRNFAPPLYLSEKNVYYPDADEIKALDIFEEKFHYGVVQDRDTFEVLNCVYDADETYELLKGTKAFDSIAGFLITDENGRETTWRSWKYGWRLYNYPHAYSIHYNLYRIAKLNPDLLSREAKEYLQFAYRTAMAMFSDSTYANALPTRGFQPFQVGNLYKCHAPMGIWILEPVIEALSAEGMTDEADTLRDAIIDASAHYKHNKYSYSGEFFSSGANPHTNAVYSYARFAGDYPTQKRAVDAILTSRSAFPAWFSFGVFHRMVGSYMTSHHSFLMLDWYLRTGDEYLLRLAYGGILANWTCIAPSGHGYNGRESRFNPPDKGQPAAHFYNTGCQSGELGVALLRNFSLLIAFVVRDSDFGLTGLGCDVTEEPGHFIVRPWSGFGFRAHIEPVRISIESDDYKMREVRVAKDGAWLEIDPAADAAAAVPPAAVPPAAGEPAAGAPGIGEPAAGAAGAKNQARTQAQTGRPEATIRVRGLAPGTYRVTAADMEKSVTYETDERKEIACTLQPVRIEKVD